MVMLTGVALERRFCSAGRRLFRYIVEVKTLQPEKMSLLLFATMVTHCAKFEPLVLIRSAANAVSLGRLHEQLT